MSVYDSLGEAVEDLLIVLDTVSHRTLLNSLESIAVWDSMFSRLVPRDAELVAKLAYYFNEINFLPQNY